MKQQNIRYFFQPLNIQRVLQIILISMMFNISSLYAVNLNSFISEHKTDGAFALSLAGKPEPLVASNNEYAGVLRAVNDLQEDINMVTGVKPEVYIDKMPKSNQIVIIGTIGQSIIIDKLIADKKINVDDIKDKWETFVVETIEKPAPGVDRALVIAGSDKRGTIFGIYELSSQIGVSPWYWWADVPVIRKENIYILPGRHTLGEPKVKYRGIFLNDEAPALTNWAYEKFGGYNHKFYVKVFELVLRLHGNFLWPAMWGNAFADDDIQNMILADEYGIVMSTSHHEPMMRADKEWDRYGKGRWEYSTNRENIYNFWVDGVKRNKDYESIYTLGMRGQQDKPMSEGENIELLEKIVKDQREILKNVFTDRDITDVPQVWCLYKEVQAYYDKGMRVPDDVILLLCDDNWGNVRILPKISEKAHSGGFGMYYHFDYVGGPRSYKWLNTNPIPRIWEQMHLTYQHGVDKIWIVNVGDLKPMEHPTEFFLDYAWDPDAIPLEKLPEYNLIWAKQKFGEKYAAKISGLMDKYTMYNGRRKPEILSPETYSLVNYREAETIVNDYNNLYIEAKTIYEAISQENKDAFYQLVLHPIEACSNLNELYFTAAKNKLYADQGRASANFMAAKVKELFDRDAAITNYYNNSLAGGKWSHMMDQTHIGYTDWQQPLKNKIPEIHVVKLKKEAEMGIAIEGSEKWWPNETKIAAIPTLDMFAQQSYYIEIFNRGETAFEYIIKPSEPWIILDSEKGTIEQEKRIYMKLDWEKVPIGEPKGTIKISGPDNKDVMIEVNAKNIPSAEKQKIKGFVESNGYISIEAEHFTNKVEANGITWNVIPGLGRTLSGVTPFPVTADVQQISEKGSRLEYKTCLFTKGKINVNVYLSPVLNYKKAEGLKYAISFDDEIPITVNVNKADTLPDWKYPMWWNEAVSNNIRVFNTEHNIMGTGEHTLKFWVIDPGIVLQKIVIDTGGEKPCYLGPPESTFID